MSFKGDCLAGRVAFVTGGGSGICKGITRVLMAHGCDAVIMARKKARLVEAAQELESLTGRQCLPVAADVRDPQAVDRAVDEAVERFGKIDILINGAAGNFLCPLDKLSHKGFKAVMEIDTYGTFVVSSAAFRKSLQQHGGVIINISATLHYSGTLLQAHAGAAKAAIDALTKHMAVEWGPYNIRVCGIAPGPIEGTEGISRLVPSSEGPSGDDDTDFRSFIPLQRLGTVDDIGHAALFLSLPEASYVTGTTLVVDGGQSLTSANFTVLAPSLRDAWLKAPVQVEGRTRSRL
ncbi:unnamed protein product [Vitrella brassicaformis CCMP3155]|uniref:2,4-dienoyl-CoA reductase [(3E)-enoyl-CoA-producing] n=1 Tax=Vitrella brassicaformis (strain CCMP3155) TaxID=1169540 RepID=A0A0G4GJ08_VITBC|nr:unnamed protein product [Vitrella brassicaformis CCMP3155]|eukprot:CEM29753.1 unnamed protein product [Vitrella brassicaformis CCMP3155]